MMLHKQWGTSSRIKTSKKLTKKGPSLTSSIISVENVAVSSQDQAPSNLSKAAEAEVEHEHSSPTRYIVATHSSSLFFFV